MNKKDRAEGLAKTKLALAQKYERLAAEAKSSPKKAQFRHKAAKYHRHAAEVLRT